MPLTELAEEVRDHLSKDFSTTHLRQIRVTANCKVILLEGLVSTYYGKLMVQHVAMTCLGNRAAVINNIKVEEVLNPST